MTDKPLHLNSQIIDENGKVLSEANLCVNIMHNRLIRPSMVDTKWLVISSCKEWIKARFTFETIKKTCQEIWVVPVLFLFIAVSGLFDKLINFIYKYKAIDFKLTEDGLCCLQVSLDKVKTFAEHENRRYPMAVRDLAEAKYNLHSARLYYAHGYYYRAHKYNRMASKNYTQVYWAIKNMVFN